MRADFYISPGKRTEGELAAAFARGCMPDARVEILSSAGDARRADLACVVGVKNAALVRQLTALGVPYLYWDKGHNRKWPEWWRFALNGHQPTDHLARLRMPGDRARQQRWRPKAWVDRPGGNILLAGSSNKYHAFAGLPNATAWAQQVVQDVREQTDGPIVWRPKPSAKDIGVIFGAGKSGNRTIEQDLASTRLVIVHGGNACLDALLAGIPSIVLGHGVTRDISSTSLEDVNGPLLANAGECGRVLNGLAYFQWSVAEIRAGRMWRFFVEELQKDL